MHLLVPLQRVAQVDHRIQQHHVGARIKAAFAHHQVLLGQLANQGAIAIENRQAADVVIAHQLHRVLERRLAADAANGRSHDFRDPAFNDHDGAAAAVIVAAPSGERMNRNAWSESHAEPIPQPAAR